MSEHCERSAPQYRPCRYRHYKLPCDQSLGATFLPGNVYGGVTGRELLEREAWQSRSLWIKAGIPGTGSTRMILRRFQEAEKRFKGLTAVGYAAAVRDVGGEGDCDTLV